VSYILLVEDYKPLRIALKRLLETEGYTVVAAEHGADALQKMQENGTPALIISDIMMPQMDGYEFYRAVRAVEAWVAVPFLFLTAKGTEEDVLLGKRLGAEDYIIKPINEETFLAAVEGRLNRAKALEKARQKAVETFLQQLVNTLLEHLDNPVRGLDQQALATFQAFSDSAPEQLAAYFSTLHDYSENLAATTERLLWLLRLQNGDLARDIALTSGYAADWYELVDLAWKTCHPQVRARVTELQRDLPADLPPAWCSDLWTGRALTLLLEQGALLLPARHTVLSVQADAQPHQVALTVFVPGAYLTEDGWSILMGRPNLDRLSTEHYQLYLAREIMHLQGGELDVFTAPDGLRMRLLLPREKPAASGTDEAVD